jgi:hypothetical protein
VPALGPLGVLRPQLGQTGLHPLAAFDHVANALFQPADRQGSLTQGTLGLMHFVAGRVMVLPNNFQRGFDLTQFGQARLELIDGLTHGSLHPLLFARGITVLEEPQLVQLQRALLLKAAVL